MASGTSYDEPIGTKTIGWQPTCKCNADIVPATVLDPFLGSGTTAKTANEMIRNAIGIDLKTDYTNMAEGRIGSGLLWSVERA